MLKARKKSPYRAFGMIKIHYAVVNGLNIKKHHPTSNPTVKQLGVLAKIL